MNRSGDVAVPVLHGTGLADILKQRTWALHRDAEQSGVIAGVLRGTVSLWRYAALLRNLEPVYAALEAALRAKDLASNLRPLARPEIYRLGALRSDLVQVAGPSWQTDLPVVPSSVSYAETVAVAAAEGGERLVAHAYVRYLGDLNGGQMLKRILARTFELPGSSLAFYDFPSIADLPGFRLAYRARIDAAGAEIGPVDRVVREAIEAFRHTIAVSADVMTLSQGAAPVSDVIRPI